MEINKLLKKLDLSNDGRYENKFYILPIADSNEYAKMYTLLDTNTTNTEFPSFELNTNNNLDKMVNYFETDKYIFVHSWIPCIGDGKPMYHVRNRHFEYDPNWRNAHQAQWEGATWGNPLIMAENGLNQTGQTIVCGHWHCSSGWAKEAGIPEFGYGSCCEPYYYKDKLIMIDACTAATKVVNVLVLEDGLLE